MIVGRRGPVEPSVHPTINKAEQKAMNWKKARRACFLVGTGVSRRIRESSSLGPLAVDSTSTIELFLTVILGQGGANPVSAFYWKFGCVWRIHLVTLFLERNIPYLLVAIPPIISGVTKSSFCTESCLSKPITHSLGSPPRDMGYEGFDRSYRSFQQGTKGLLGNNLKSFSNIFAKPSQVWQLLWESLKNC